MLVSHKYKFITISIPKTGTKSLRASLCTKDEHVDGRSNNSVIDIVGRHKDKTFTQHSSFLQCKKYMKDIKCDINSYFIFAVARNPWDRYVSYMLYNNESLEKAIRTHHPQSYYILNNDLLAVDQLAEFSNLQEEVDIFCDKVNINRVTLPHLNKSKREDYKTYYTDDLIELVREKESKIIDLMGYTYD
jgi:hypothetical protein